MAAAEDEVRLAMPADPEFLRLARVTAMGLASRLGFTFDEIEDLRIAIDEVCFTLIGTKGRIGGNTELSYLPRKDGLEIVASGTFVDDDYHGLTELSELIIQATTDEFEIDDRSRPTRVRIVKLHSGA